MIQLTNLIRAASLKVIVLCLYCITWASAQPLQNSFDRDKNAFVVKQYDEFIERFNYSTKGRLYTYLKQNHPGLPLNRQMFLKSLFNAEDQGWNKTEVDAFISQVTAPGTPVMLNFSDEGWYVEAHCLFEYNGHERAGSLILRNRQAGTLGTKWEVVAVNAPFMQIPAQVKPVAPPKDPTVILSPMSHTTEFASLYRLLRDRENLGGIFSTTSTDKSLRHLVGEIRSGRLCLEQINGVTYHLLQIDGWIVTLRDYARSLPNSGLLIAGLNSADSIEKEAYLRKRLNITP